MLYRSFSECLGVCLELWNKVTSIAGAREGLCVQNVFILVRPRKDQDFASGHGTNLSNTVFPQAHTDVMSMFRSFTAVLVRGALGGRM